VAAELAAFAMLLSVVVADRVTGRDPRWSGPYVVAVLVGALVGGLAAAVWGTNMLALFVPRPDGLNTGFVLYIALGIAMPAIAVVWVVLHRRRAQWARERMHAATLGRIDAERRSIESALQAMQARVEPQFLLNTLAQVKQLYARDASLGERVLDSLIAYLRAAMPRMRDTSSTLGQEIALARAYLDIVKVRLGDRLRYAMELDDAAVEARFPPMMLLPLVDHAIACASDSSGSAVDLRIGVALGARRLRLTIGVEGGALVDNAGVAGIRERLAALFGDEATLALRRRGQQSVEGVLEVPLQGRPT
jgi:LytS/YehU family sensor histidine kinase